MGRLELFRAQYFRHRERLGNGGHLGGRAVAVQRRKRLLPLQRQRGQFVVGVGLLVVIVERLNVSR